MESQMTSMVRVLCALQGGEPDRVPFCEHSIDKRVIKAISGCNRDLNEKEISELFNRDIIPFRIMPPIYAQKEIGSDGQEYYTDGLIKSEDDLKLIKLPDPCDSKFYQEAVEFVKDKGEYAAAAITRLGISPLLNGMGLETFSYALVDNVSLIEEILDRYTSWAAVVVERLIKIGFDLIWTFDDIAFNTGPFVSVEVFRKLILPRLKRVTDRITIPWIYHSDGNLMPILDDLLTLGMSGLHPIEPGPMDIKQLKKEYGRRLCLVGNISVDNLARGTPDDIIQEVRERIEEMGPGGGYMVTSSNSIPGYCKPENVMAMVKAVQKYGRYPIKSHVGS